MNERLLRWNEQDILKFFEEFEELYNKVFDEEGNVKACGRELCKKLILKCIKLSPVRNYGNQFTGFMNEKTIKDLFEGRKYYLKTWYYSNRD